MNYRLQRHAYFECQKLKIQMITIRVCACVHCAVYTIYSSRTLLCSGFYIQIHTKSTMKYSNGKSKFRFQHYIVSFLLWMESCRVILTYFKHKISHSIWMQSSTGTFIVDLNDDCIRILSTGIVVKRWMDTLNHKN